MQAITFDETEARVVPPWIVIHTDGACPKNGTKAARGGVGVFFGVDDPRNVSACFSDRPTSSRCELAAIFVAVSWIKENYKDQQGPARIASDSRYAVSSLNEWARHWATNGWRTSTRQPVKNKEMIQEIIAAREACACPIELVHVRRERNVGADALAVAGARLTA